MALDGAGMGFWQEAVATGRFVATPGALALHGLPPGGAPDGEAALACVHPEDLPRLRALRTMAIETGRGFETEYRLMPHLGERWLSVIARVLPGADGRPELLVGLNRDITTQKLAEREKADRDALLALALEAGGLGVWHVDLESGQQVWHASLSRMLGVADDDIPMDVAGSTGLVHPTDRERSTAKFLDALRHRTDYHDEFQALRPDGRTAWFQSRARVVTRPDGSSRMVGIAQDITATRAAAARLTESESRLRLLIETIPQTVWTALPDGTCDYVSPQWIAFTGRPESDHLGTGWLTALHPDDVDRTKAAWDAMVAVDGATPYDVEHRVRRHDGSYHWFKARGIPLRDEQGRLVRVFGTSTDIDDMKRAEERQRLLMAELNHRVKNALAMAQSLAFQTSLGADSLEAFHESFSNRLGALAAAHDLLTRGGWTNTCLHTLVATTLRGLGADERLTTNRPLILVEAHAALTLNLALHELSVNALKYGALSVPEGRVEVVWTIHPPPPIPGGNDASGVGNASRVAVLRLTWLEQGGPPVAPPQRRGFGSRLIEMVLGPEFGGRAALDFQPEGLVCIMELPISDKLRSVGQGEGGPPAGPFG